MAAKVLKKVAGTKIKRWWPLLLLLAMFLVEQVYAPRISAASALTTDAKTPADAGHPAASSIQAPSSTAWINPSAIQQTIQDSIGSASDPRMPVNDTISLLPTQPETTTINAFDGGGGRSETGPAYTIPATFQPTDHGGELDFGPVPESGVGQVPRHGLIVTDATPVPEPGMVSVLLGGSMLAARRPVKSKKCEHRTPNVDH